MSSPYTPQGASQNPSSDQPAYGDGRSGQSADAPHGEQHSPSQEAADQPIYGAQPTHETGGPPESNAYPGYGEPPGHGMPPNGPNGEPVAYGGQPGYGAPPPQATPGASAQDGQPGYGATPYGIDSGYGVPPAYGEPLAYGTHPGYGAPYGAQPQPPYAQGGQSPFAAQVPSEHASQPAPDGGNPTAPPVFRQTAPFQQPVPFQQPPVSDVKASDGKNGKKAAITAGFGAAMALVAIAGLFLPYFAGDGESLAWASANSFEGSMAPFFSSLVVLIFAALVPLCWFGKQSRRLTGGIAGLVLVASGSTVLANWFVNFSPDAVDPGFSRGPGFWVIGVGAIFVILAGLFTLFFGLTSTPAPRSASAGNPSVNASAPHGYGPKPPNAPGRTVGQPNAVARPSAPDRSGTAQWPPPRK